MKTLIAALMAGFLLFSAGCGTIQGPSVTEEVRYGGQCALGVSQGDCNLKGFSQWKVKYRGKLYFFQNEDSKDQFLSDLDKLIERADRSWENRVQARD